MSLQFDVADALTSRMLSFALLLFTGTILSIALFLEPSTVGHGTHTQLGLNTCTFLAWTGIPCPMCGMTTTFALMVRGQWFSGVMTQPMGVVLFLMTAGTAVTSVIELVYPMRIWARLWSRMVQVEGRIVLSFVSFFILAWVYKIWMMSS